ncbi:hypothetical protein BD779DRAFT_1181196 [Infundibulicybe gibba]|nr:hypothetical protein BD779DRAFT_1181196 [Infundibulicybe gibba]
MAPVSASSMAGPLLIGFLLNTGLFGILSSQIYGYHLSFPNDKLHLRLLAYSMFLAEMAQTILTICDGYWIFVTGFGDTSILMSAGRMYWVYSPIIGGASVVATHMYSAHRISILYNSRTLAFIVVVISVAEFVAALVSACHLRNQALSGSKPDTHYISVLIWTVACSLCDTTIAVLMTLWLLRWGGTGSKATRTIVTRLLWLSVETGVMLAALAIAELILLVDHPGQEYFIIIIIAISKCHSVTWFASLNNRTGARRLEDSIFETGIQFQGASTRTQTGAQCNPPVPVWLPSHSFSRKIEVQSFGV